MSERSAPGMTLSIAAVERDTGLSKDTLRVWERRYGFPTPLRDAFGERAYPLEQIERLRAIKRLIDAGHRPGRIIGLPVEALQELSETSVAREPIANGLDVPDLQRFVDLVRAHDVDALRRQLAHAHLSTGLVRFIVDVLAPLNVLIGDAWMRGQIQVFEEHLYTEAVERVLHRAIGCIPAMGAQGQPRVLLSTFPTEPHGLGLLMAEALLTMQGCHCMALGVQTPVWDTVLAAQAQRIDVVALSFTGCMNPNHVVEGLSELRAKLPANCEIWTGGAAPVLHRRTVPGVRPVPELRDLPAEVERWRQERA